MKRNFFKVCLLLLISATLSNSNAFAQNTNFSELEKTVENELREKNAAGAAVTVIKGDKIIFAKGFGTANIETNQPVTPETLFQIGSVTKTFTAALILKMAEEGKLNLDLPISTYDKNINSQLGKITLRQLLSQTSGIIDEPDEFGAGDESLMASYINSWRDDYVLFEPGKVFSYSNSGFALAGFTAQEQSGKLYADLMNEKIFQLFGMKWTTFRPTVAMTYPLAVGHLTKPNEKPQVVRPLAQDARLYPAGTIYANLSDLSRFAVAFLNEGKIDGKEIISPKIIQEMSAPHARQLSAADDTSYGYGLFINTNRGVRQIWHEGSMTGYVAQIRFVPAQKIALIILSNTNNVSFDKTQEKALEMMIGSKPTDSITSKSAIPMDETEMAKYVGTYSQPKRWNSDVFIKDKKLFIRQFGLELSLSKIGENRFAFQFPNAPRPLEIFIQPAANGQTGFMHQYVWAFKKIR